jgi:hypothetical protein
VRLRWTQRQLELISKIYHLGNVWAIGAKRSGKSTAIVEAIRACAFEWEPEVNGIIAAPTFGQLERNFLENWRELVPSDRYREVNDPKNPHILCFLGEGKTVKIYKASGQYPKHIEGLTVGWCAFTELQDGEAFWNTVKARVSDQRAKRLRRFGDGLPEEGWLVRELDGDGKGVYHRVTFTVKDNAQNLHPSYIDDMRRDFTPREALMYLEGKFVGAADAVYPYFRRSVHAAAPISFLPGTKVLIGLDFNLSQQSAVLCQWHQGSLYVFDEIMKPGTVQDQAKRLEEKLTKEYRLPHKDQAKVLLIPDASGRSRQHALGPSSFAVLEAAGFHLRAGAANPDVEDRDLSVNVLLENAKGQHRLFIDPRRCPRTIESLAGLRNDKREGSEYGHACDALGYVVWQVAPQRRAQKQFGSVTAQDVNSLPGLRASR